MITQTLKREQEKLEAYLNKNGLKLSAGRKAVFDMAMHAHGHFTAEDLVKECKTQRKKTSRATIYRALRELLEAKVIRKTAFGEKHDHFEHVYDEKPHHHARCLRCYDVIEFPDLGEDEKYKPILKKLGFKIIGHEMHFYGICTNCQKEEYHV